MKFIVTGGIDFNYYFPVVYLATNINLASLALQVLFGRDDMFKNKVIVDDYTLPAKRTSLRIQINCDCKKQHRKVEVTDCDSVTCGVEIS